MPFRSAFSAPRTQSQKGACRPIGGATSLCAKGWQHPSQGLDFPFSWHGSWLLYRSLNGSSYAIPSDGRLPLRLLRQINGEQVSSACWA